MRLILILSCLALFSCDDRKDLLKLANEKPSALIKSNNSWTESKYQNYTDVIFDTVKLGDIYEYGHQIVDDSKNLKINTTGVYNGSIFIRENLNDNLVTDTLSIKEKTNVFLFNPSIVGDNIIDVLTYDQFNEKSENRIYLNCFDNLSPISDLRVSRITTLGGYNYEFDASASFDRDAKYGGSIVEYYFEVRKAGSLLHQTTGSSSIINFTFIATGTYDINVRVRDNNNDWSNNSYQTITIT